MKIVQIAGARPQFIKYLPIQKAIAYFKDDIKDILVHTGQHYDYAMSKVFFEELGIREPDYHLGVGSGSHGFQTGKIIEKVEVVLQKEKPDAVVVYGDTNSTLGAAIAAAKLHIPVIHVEAGLRSYNKYTPEEINRVVTDHISTLLLCPTETAVLNLQREGFTNVINDGKLVSDFSVPFSCKVDPSNPIVVNVGDVMYDAILYGIELASKRSDVLNKLNLSEKGYMVLTIHRAENTDNPKRLEELFGFIKEVSSGLPVIFPVHPRTNKVLADGLRIPENIRLIEPLSYLDMLWLVKNSRLVLTDSGGLQKEAYWLKVPCVTLRDETEWVETLQSGWNVLYKDYKGEHQILSTEDKFYGDGRAAERIIRIVTEIFGVGK